MLGSVHDAEDALQESLLSAWRGLKGFEGRSSLRPWLYRITTHACLRFGRRRPRRILSPDHGPPRIGTADLGEWVSAPIWLEPWPGDAPARQPWPSVAPASLPWTADPPAHEPGPAAVYERRESIELAFVAALQHLPSNQRAVLILREVLEFSAAEVANLLDMTPVAVNSALQRARKTVDERVPAVSQQQELAALGERGRRDLIDAFVAAFERADVDALVTLLADDVRFTMPPLPAWFDGRANVVRFFAERVFATPWRLVEIHANAQPAVACYQQSEADGPFRLGAINVLSFSNGHIARLNGFLDPEAHRHFTLPPQLR